MDKVVVITGASSGIGAALARLVGGRGGKPVLAARRERELAEAARAAGPEAHAVVADVTRRADVQRLLDEAVARFGRVDVWVNNAGRGITRPVEQLSDAELDEMLLVNCKSALYGMQVATAHFRQRRRGHLINVSSMLSRTPFASFRSAYSAAKAALNMLTTNLRMDLAAELPEVHVTLFLPGVVATDFGASALGGGPDSRQLPGAQPVEEVALALLDAIEHPRAEVFSRPVYREQQSRYYAAEDVAAVEPPGRR